MSKKMNWKKSSTTDKAVYISCIIIALLVMVLTIMSAFHVLDSAIVSKVTTILLNIELIFLSIGTWKSNRVFSIVGICIALILIIITLI